MAYYKGKSNKAEPKADVYQIVTDRILDALEHGVCPWHKSWKSVNELPKNLVSKKTYHGSNLFVLGLASYSSPYFLTYKQAQNLGGNVKRGEKGWPVTFWSFFKKEEVQKDGSTKEMTIPFLRYFTVFNTDQCEGLEEKVPVTDVVVRPDAETIIECEKIVDGYKDKPPVHKENKAVYHPSTDTVGMPEITSFESSEEYYSTLFHEFAHSTGHESRLNRKGDNQDSSHQKYGKEELIAEMTSTFVCAVAGIENKTFDNSAAYLQGWIDEIKGDRKLLVSAGSAATKAANYILGTSEEKEEEAE